MSINATIQAIEEKEDSKQKILNKYFGWIRHISVEPTMWLYMMAFMITTVVEQSFFFYKSCHVNHGFPEDICRNVYKNRSIISENDFNDVQSTVSNFRQWDNIVGHVIPIILALYLGNWSDRRGRKLPLIIGLISKIIYSGMIIVNAIMTNWDLYMIIYTASLPMSLLGGDVAIFASCFAYISDVSSRKQRTLRVTLLDIAYLSTIPTGVKLGSYLFTNVVNRSYEIMFVINVTLLILSVIYSLIVLKWQTHPRQQSLVGVNVLTDFFDKEHAKATIKTLTKSRPRSAQLHLWIIFLAMTLYTFQRDEKFMSYMFTQKIFHWEVANFSDFRTFQSTLFVVAMLIVAPIFTKIFGMRDTVIVSIGALSHALGRVFFASAAQPSFFYTGAVVAAIGPVAAPVLRSMASKVVPITERGKVLAILSVCDNAAPFLSGVLYSQLYNHTAPSSIYWLTFYTQIAVAVLVLVIHFSSGSNEREADNYETEEPSVIEPDHDKIKGCENT